ncbi:MAG: flavodoxin family protein [Peptococcaceae bacterium]|nr:flavodoxin family protein [Peptococcaceae bacterium]
MKVVIVYASIHHGNTRKLVEAIADKYEIDMVDATTQQKADLSQYELIGFASGIDFGKFYESIERFLKENLPEHKKVFFLYTCARTSESFTQTMRTEALQKAAVLTGEYGCRGYNTYGAWKLIGGMNRHHPDRAELDSAVRFYESLLENLQEK